MSSVGSRRVTGWVGWIWFAALILVMDGCFNVIDGLVALFKHQALVQTSNGPVVFNFTAWGWILMVIGILQLLVGVCLMLGQVWARLTAIFLVLLSAIAQITVITVNPWWSITVIALNILVLWALLVHGEEAEHLANP